MSAFFHNQKLPAKSLVSFNRHRPFAIQGRGLPTSSSTNQFSFVPRPHPPPNSSSAKQRPRRQQWPARRALITFSPSPCRRAGGPPMADAAPPLRRPHHFRRRPECPPSPDSPQTPRKPRFGTRRRVRPPWPALRCRRSMPRRWRRRRLPSQSLGRGRGGGALAVCAARGRPSCL